MLQLSLTSLLLFVAMTIGVSASNSTTPAVEVVGNKFYFTNNGTQFLMRGIAYQQNTANGSDTSFVDPLADKTSCLRDIAYFTKLNTNVLRVYAVNTSLDHDDCMNALSDAGIYVIADLSEPDLSINRDSPEWNLQLYNRYTDVVDMFAKYNNVLGFFAGNEVTNNASNTDALAFVKAAVRDVKAYISQKNYRTIPVGYSSNDDADTRIAIADYFSCGSLDERADFFGINMYEWCGDSSFTTSGYSDRTKEYLNLTIPVFFSEYGCNADLPRKFTEVGTIFSSEMTDVWSGGIVYMYFEEANNYGLVSIDGSSVSTMADFKYYSSEINNISPTYALLASASLAESTQTLACPASALTWKASSTLPPTPDQSICDCVSNSLTCVIDDGVLSKDYGDLYSYICDKIDCSAITASGSNGTYGGVSFCSDKEKLSYVLNEYYNANGKSSSACDFSGSALINKSASVASSCSSKVSQATKAVSGGSTVNNSGDSSSSSGSSSSSSGGSSSSSSVPKKSGASQKQISTGQLLAVGIVVTSFVGGLSMVMLE